MSSATACEVVRHYRRLSERDAAAVVEAVADLIVSYLKAGQDSQENPDTCPRAGVSKRQGQIRKERP